MSQGRVAFALAVFLGCVLAMLAVGDARSGPCRWYAAESRESVAVFSHPDRNIGDGNQSRVF